MEAKHTPGPWDVDYLDKHGQRVVRSQHIEVCTCWHHSVGSIEREMEANAQLIAAAPELLAMLKMAQLWLDVDGRYDMQGINAAIAKAEGR